MNINMNVYAILQGNIEEFNRQLRSERTKAALQAAKRRGVKLGNPNLADVRNSDTRAATKQAIANAKKYAEDVYEIIKEIESEHGKLSTRMLAGHLNEAGYKTSRNKPFSSMAVSRIKRRMAAIEKKIITDKLKEGAKSKADMSRHAARDFKTVTLRLNAYEHARLEELAEANGCGILKTVRIALDNEYIKSVANEN